MIKKLKIGLLIAALSFVGAISVAHASNDVNYSNDTTFMVSGRPYIIAAGSKASTVVVDSGTIVVTMSTAGPLTLESANGDTLTNNGSLAITCSGATSVVTVPANTATVTFTPTATATCNNAPVGGGGISSGGGGGGGGSYTPPVTTTPAAVSVSPTVTTTQVVLPAGCSSPAGYSTMTGVSCSTSAVPAVTPASAVAGCGSRTTGFSTMNGASCMGNIPSVTTAGGLTSATSYNFGTTTLKLGSKGAAVKQLQMFLNANLKMNLKVDGVLGKATIAIIKQWQKAHGLMADGLVGAKTKAMMNSEAQ